MAVLTVVTTKPRSTTEMLGGLAPMSVFRLDGDRYMKTATRMAGGDVQCLKLDTGSTYRFPPSTLVEPAKSATLTVEDL